MVEENVMEHPGRGLEGIVGLQQGIRAVSQSVGRVNLVALNAIVLTESTEGGGAEGFALVAKEMRVLAGRMEQETLSLTTMTAGAARAAAELLSAHRRRRLLAECVRVAPRAMAKLDLDAPVRLARQAVRDAHGRVRACLAETSKLGLMLTVVARFARLEAAYGNGIAEKLAIVSTDFANASESISSALLSLQDHQRRLEDSE